MTESFSLNSQQQTAVIYKGKSKAVLVSAGAGCGKTRTMIARGAFLIESGVHPAKILMITFTNRAAREIKHRLKAQVGPKSKEVYAGTFHAFCLKIMRQMPKSFGITGLNILDIDDQHSLISLVREKYVPKKGKKHLDIPKAPELVRLLSYCRNTCQGQKQYFEQHTEMEQASIDACCDIYQEYDKAKKIRGYVDFDDLLEIFGNVLEQKKPLLHQIAKTFTHCLIDEYQDTNPLQFKILRQFYKAGIHLYAVGDAAQSIYMFRGAQFANIYSFSDMFANSTTLYLSENYRSYQEILDFSNWLLKRSPLKYGSPLLANRGSVGTRPKIVDFDSIYEEASWIVDQVAERWQAEAALKSMMILVRTAYDSKAIEAELIQRDIPYVFIGGTSLLKSAHVRDLLALLRAVRNSEDDLAWMRYLKLWPGVGPKTAEKIITAILESPNKQAAPVLSAKLGFQHPGLVCYQSALAHALKPKKAVESAVSQLKMVLKERYDKWHFRSRDLELLSVVAGRYKSLTDFIDAFTLEPMTETEIDRAEDTDVLKLITVHSAKGTEAETCFVACAGPGKYPHCRSFGDIDQEEEERRVLYVAITRAKNELIITRANDNRSGFYMTNKPTEGEEYFLATVPEDLIEHEIKGWGPDSNIGFRALQDIF